MAVTLLSLSFCGLVVIVLFRRALQVWIRTTVEGKSRLEQCKCGYDLKGLDVARCPECGRVIGFDVTAEDLELTTEQLALIQQRRAQRAAQDFQDESEQHAG
jgi:hypothetical protein